MGGSGVFVSGFLGGFHVSSAIWYRKASCTLLTLGAWVLLVLLAACTFDLLDVYFLFGLFLFQFFGTLLVHSTPKTHSVLEGFIGDIFVDLSHHFKKHFVVHVVGVMGPEYSFDDSVV